MVRSKKGSYLVKPESHIFLLSLFHRRCRNGSFRAGLDFNIGYRPFVMGLSLFLPMHDLKLLSASVCVGATFSLA